MSDASKLPILRAALGESLLEVRRQSSYPLHFERLQDDDLVTVDKPVQFGFSGADGFDLPPTRFASLNCTAAMVVAIDVALHLEYLPLAQVQPLSAAVVRALEAHGWQAQPSDGRVVGPEELKLRLADPAASAKSYWYLASHAKDSARAIVVLRHAHRAGRMADHDLYMLNVKCRDDVLADKAMRVAGALRHADGVPEARARGISLEPYVERVRRNWPI